MKQLLLICSVITVIFLLPSCGTAKKLEQANAQVNQLQAANSQLNEKIVGLEKGVGELQKQNTALAVEAEQAREMRASVEKT